MPRFFVAVQLGAEFELERELRSFWHLMLDLDGLPTRSLFPEVEPFKGGIEIECDLHLGLQINFFSRLANRVLMRLTSFRARYFDQFEKELQKAPFQKWIKSDTQIELQISHHKSRLNNERNLIESATRAIKSIGLRVESNVVETSRESARKTSQGPESIDCQQIFIRIESDHVSVSLDTTGSHLHFRGYRFEHGEAPMRETLAAQFYQRVQGVLDEKGILIPDVIVDPFCGSGTLLIESAISGRLNSARSYSFLHWQSLPAMMQSKTFFQNYFWLRPSASGSSRRRLFGVEKDGATLNKAERNLERAADQYALQLDLNLIKGDCGLAQIPSVDSGLILTNPPYGERLTSASTLHDLERFLKLNSGTRWIVFMIVPKSMTSAKLGSLNLMHQSSFENQGLPLQLVGYSL